MFSVLLNKKTWIDIWRRIAFGVEARGDQKFRFQIQLQDVILKPIDYFQFYLEYSPAISTMLLSPQEGFCTG